MKTRQIAIDRLHANDWNPNRLTEEKFEELKAEVRHLNGVPKPLVVRKNEEGLQIIDGEQGWRAAKDAGLETVACEVIEADDFEGMRQTYKRNQHGTHDPVLQGKLFRRMMRERKLSARQLAKVITVSEGTIRNSLLYAELAAKFGVEAVAKLPTRHLRILKDLPKTIGRWWAEAGADYLALLGEKKLPGKKAWEERLLERRVSLFKRLETNGYTQFGQAPFNGKGFVAVVDHMTKLLDWDLDHSGDVVKLDELRQYSFQLFPFVNVEREYVDDYWLDRILDVDAGKFLITPEEFKRFIGDMERLAGRDFDKRLQLAIHEATGTLPPEEPEGVAEKLERLRADEFEKTAPDWLKGSPLPFGQKRALLEVWNEEAEARAQQDDDAIPEEVYHKAATMERVAKGECGVHRGLERLAAEHQREQELAAQIEAETVETLAPQVAERFHKSKKEQARMASVLRQLTKAELLTMLNEFQSREESRRRLEEITREIHAALGRA